MTMDVVVDSSRQSTAHTLGNHDHYSYSPTQVDRETRYPADVPRTMAMSHDLISPRTSHPARPPQLFNQIPRPSSTAPTSGMISPPNSHLSESRRHSDDKDMSNNAHRMSLPSIHEALANPKPSTYAPAPSSSVNPSPHQFTFSQPPTPTSRSFGGDVLHPPAPGDQGPRRSPPPAPVYPYSRPEANARPHDGYERSHQLPSIRTALTDQAPAAPRPEFPRFDDQRETIMNGRPPPPRLNGSYPGYTGASGPHSGPNNSPPSPFSQNRSLGQRYVSEYQRDYPKQELPIAQDAEYMQKNFGTVGVNYGGVVKRHLDYYDCEMILHKLVGDVTSLASTANAMLAEAQRHSHRGVHSDNAPSLHDISAMERDHERIGSQLRSMREAVQQNIQERPVVNPGRPMPTDYELDEMGQWSEEGKSNYGGPDAKKRRGRAAAPGRCHSCNRAETPEWRRGPDGARTLCNACGLHYAKLTRKNMGQQNAKNGGSSLRKSDDGSTRP